MGNGYGNVHVPREENMAAYDEAPPPLRWLMRNAVASYSAPHMIGHYWQLRQDHNLSHRDAIGVLADAIEARDREQTLKAYGPTHPEARA